MLFQRPNYDWLIAGLGNPGAEYEKTRHNTGFMTLDLLAARLQVKVSKERFKALTATVDIGGESVMLMKPQTFMNLSGESVREIVNFYKIPQERFVVIFDDTSLPCGSVRIREKGSHGGHNGIRNIIDQMGTDVFNRIKVGIGEKPKGWDLADYVLAKFSPDDLPAMEEGMEKAVKGVELILSRGVAEAANRVNQKPKSMKKQKALQEQAEKAEKETEKTTDGVNKE